MKFSRSILCHFNQANWSRGSRSCGVKCIEWVADVVLATRLTCAEYIEVACLKSCR